jgi:hypothetical protein
MTHNRSKGNRGQDRFLENFGEQAFEALKVLCFGQFFEQQCIFSSQFRNDGLFLCLMSNGEIPEQNGDLALEMKENGPAWSSHLFVARRGRRSEVHCFRRMTE